MGEKGQGDEGRPLEGMSDMTKNRCGQQAGRGDEGSEGYLSFRTEKQKSNSFLCPEGTNKGGKKPLS